jgi:glycosyltransferase involved in cell wall biosynthesis
MKKRIVNLTNHPLFPMSFGGTRVAHGFVSGLAQAGHDVTLIAWKTGQEPNSLPYQMVHFFPEWNQSKDENPLPTRIKWGNQVKQKWPRTFACYWKIRWQLTRPWIAIFAGFRAAWIVRAKGAQMLIVDYPFLGLPAWVAARCCGVEFVVHSHNIEYRRLRSMGAWTWPLMKIYETWVYQRADKIVWITETDAKWAHETMRVSPDKSVLCPYGGELKSLLMSQSQARQEVQLPLNPREFWILYFGRMDYLPNVEGFRILCDEIIPRVEEHLPSQVNYLVCGAELPAREKNHPRVVCGDVTYLGFVPQIETYLKAADLVINPILKGGGLKTKVVEAIAQGRTVIATDSGAMGIDQAVCGTRLVTVRDGDWDRFAEQIVHSLTHPLEADDKVSDQFLGRYCSSNSFLTVAEALFSTQGAFKNTTP